MGLIDTHTHLESFALKGSLPETLARARAAGLEAMITVGTSPDDWGLYRRLAAENPGFVHFTAGLHPCAVDPEWEQALAHLETFWAATRPPGAPGAETAADGHHPEPVALGEIGLDRFHLPKDEGLAQEVFAWQRAAFEAGLRLARRLRCPVVVHSRGAFRECVEVIDASGFDWHRVVFHCFTEGKTEMAELVSRGAVGSFTGVITYKNAENVRVAARTQGLARAMVETDAPYLTPVPHRGKLNEPAFLRHTADYCATEVFGVTTDEFARITTENARRFYGLG